MSVLDPNEFFLRNGGQALMEAHGAADRASLSGYFGSVFPTWGGDKTTRPSTTAVTAALVCWDGGMILRTAAKRPDGLPAGIDVEKGVGAFELMKLAMGAFDLPRPLLFLTVGASYGPDIRNAKFSLDPDRIVMSGKISGDLDRLRLKLIENFAASLEISTKDLRKLARTHEAALVGAPHLWQSPAVVSKIRKLKAVPKKADSQAVTEIVGQFWAGIDALPPAGDPAWDAMAAIS